ncbi:MAG: DNA methyltransferase [Phycisphaerae bacterium]|nr:DNA methyltransferase [Phycisphaerae bacterium]
MDFTTYLKAVRKNLADGNATEHTHRPALKALLESAPGLITATNEPKQIDCGAPDFVVKRRQRILGYVECKDIGINLDEKEKDEQLQRYFRGLGNLILTDYIEFRWYVDGSRRTEARLGRVDRAGKIKLLKDGPAEVEQLMSDFLAHAPLPISRPKDLAVRMSRLTHMIRDIVVETFANNEASDLLKDLREALAKVLIPDIAQDEKTAEFADMFAQTLAYGLFAACCNHPAGKPFVRLGAAGEIPKTNPFLRHLFETITGADLDDEPYAPIVDDLVQLLDDADIHAVLLDFGKRTRRQDPIVHFYETFLAEYDPALREARGVYYTPEPVVGYIVRSVDHLLKDRFGCPGGLADEATITYERQGETDSAGKRTSVTETAPRVLILDPACGTGTFLYTVVDHIREQFMSAGNAGLWNGYVRKHLLPRLFGFELLMAPYAVAHFKLAMQLAGHDLSDAQRKNWAYDFAGDERLGVYLTNTLEEAEKKITTLYGPLRALSDEAEAAAEIKRDMPIMVVMGNPPYSNFGMMNKGKWILNLLKDYKKDLHEKKLNIDDDFIKFIRFGQWRIEQTGAGILTLITNNTYIDGITHRRMRQSLMETFTDIYILDLHGSSKKKEESPDGSKDKNVFDIQQGVAIGIFVKEPGKSGPATVHHAELWGLRDAKYKTLNDNAVDTTQWTKLQPTSEHFFFVPKDFRLLKEYSGTWRIKEIFTTSGPGVKTERDRVSIHWDRNVVLKVVNDFRKLSEHELREKYNLKKDSRDWKIENAKNDVSANKNDDDLVRPILYRPFDVRMTWYSGQTRGFIGTPGFPVMRHMLAGSNLALIACRQFAEYKYFTVNCTDKLTEISSQPYAPLTLFPVYIYPDPSHPAGRTDEYWPAGKDDRRPNLNPEFVAEMEEKLGLKFVSDGCGDLKTTFGPEDVFHYIYAVFHSPTYRSRYAEFLKIDFPRLPLTSNVQLFVKLCGLGAELVALHLLESPALGKSPVRYPVKDDDTVAKGYPKYVPTDGGRVQINAKQYFEPVAEEVWEFHVGGYQVCQKWLKDRRGRKLSYDDITHYRKVIVSLGETIRLMAAIDTAVPAWPIK